MKQNIFPDYDALCAAVAERVCHQLRSKPNSALVFPTGNTPLGLFRRLADLAETGAVDFGRARIVILDEYAGLEAGDQRSLTDWLKHELLAPVGVSPKNIHGFENGLDALEARIKSIGGLDLAILGLGPNGHLGFNEPGSRFDSCVRKVDLAQESITSNAAYWGSEQRVPRQGYTLGLGTLSEARAIILMVSGAAKSGILKRSLQDPVSVQIPASMLRNLRQAQVYADEQSMATQ
jgi:glucosamine-6-phosphate deaminase